MKAIVKDIGVTVNVGYDEKNKCWRDMDHFLHRGYHERELIFLGKKNINIDWEARKYEIVKELFKGVCIDTTLIQPAQIQIMVENAMNFADAIITELKKAIENE